MDIFIRTLPMRLALAGLSSWASSLSNSAARLTSFLRTRSFSRVAQGMPPKAMEVLTSDLAPTALALTRLAAQTRPPMMLPRPERRITSPSQ